MPDKPLHQLKSFYTLFISGPTASGKTNLSLKIATQLQASLLRDNRGRGAQIINADIGQFYTKLSIGTAKPDWQHMPIKHHLFDVLGHPTNLNVATYRTMLLEVARKIWEEGDIPIVVGGSLFYIQALFFPPRKATSPRAVTAAKATSSRTIISSSKPDNSRERNSPWQTLYAIDPVRASAIHPHDTYRVERALAIWNQTGKKPSAYEPEFTPPCHSRIIFINTPRDTLYERINLRTKQMIREDGWLEEVKGLRDAEWEAFLKIKKLIGYVEIFTWLENGERADQVDELIRLIQKKTRLYAKRQITFWKKFHTLLICYGGKSAYRCKTLEIKEANPAEANLKVEAIVQSIKEDTKEHNDLFV